MTPVSGAVRRAAAPKAVAPAAARGTGIRGRFRAWWLARHPPADTWTFTLAEAAGEALARRKAWIGA